MNLDIGLALGLVAHNAGFALEFAEPPINQRRGVVVIGEKKAREHSRIPAKSPLVVGKGPTLNESEASVARDPPHTFGLRKFRLDGSDARHLLTLAFMSILDLFQGDRQKLTLGNDVAFVHSGNHVLRAKSVRLPNPGRMLVADNAYLC